MTKDIQIGLFNLHGLFLGFNLKKVFLAEKALLCPLFGPKSLEGPRDSGTPANKANLPLHIPEKGAQKAILSKKGGLGWGGGAQVLWAP